MMLTCALCGAEQAMGDVFWESVPAPGASIDLCNACHVHPAEDLWKTIARDMQKEEKAMNQTTTEPSKPIEPLEPENDHYRSRLRQIIHKCEHYPNTTTLGEIAKIAREAIARPRSNGVVIDGLEKTIGDLRSQLIDVDVLYMEKRHAESVAKQTEQFARIAERELMQLRARGPFGKFGQKLDAWLHELESYRPKRGKNG